MRLVGFSAVSCFIVLRIWTFLLFMWFRISAFLTFEGLGAEGLEQPGLASG